MDYFLVNTYSLGYIACQKEYKTYYTTCSELINDLNAGVYEKTLGKRMRKYISFDLLIPATECTRANSCKRNTHPRIRNSGNLKKDPPNHRGQRQDVNQRWHLVFYAVKDHLHKNRAVAYVCKDNTDQNVSVQTSDLVHSKIHRYNPKSVLLRLLVSKGIQR